MCPHPTGSDSNPFRELGRETLHCNSFPPPPPPAFSSVLGAPRILSSPQLCITVFAETQYTIAHLEEQPLAWMSRLR